MSALLPEGLVVSGLRAGYRDAVVIDGVSLALAPGATSFGRVNRWSLSQVVIPDLNCTG